jgi:hypothetical protein
MTTLKNNIILIKSIAWRYVLLFISFEIAVCPICETFFGLRGPRQIENPL